jgi:hypothetical protein
VEPSRKCVRDGLFSALHSVPTGPRPKNAVSEAHFSWNYTTFLDFAAIAWAGWLGFLHMRKMTHERVHAQDERARGDHYRHS